MTNVLFTVLSIAHLAFAAPRPITEKEIVKDFVERSPKLESLRQLYRVSDKKLDLARAQIFPTIDANSSVTAQKVPQLGSSTSLPQERTSYISTLDLKQPLYVGGKVGSGLKIAKLNLLKAEQDLLSAKQQALVDLLIAAYSVGSAMEQKQVLLDSQKFQQSYLSITRLKLSRGGARSYELSQAEADFTSYESRLRASEKTLANSRAQLISALQMSPEEIKEDTLEFRLKSPAPYDLPGLDQLLKTANQNRPEVRSAEIAVEVAKAQKWYDLSDELPNLNLVGQIGYQSPNRDDFWTQKTDMYSVGLQLKVPIFSGLSSVAKYQGAAYNISAADKSLEEQRRTVKLEVTQEYENLKAAREVFDSTSKWVAQARKALEQSLESYRVGTISSVQVLQIQASREKSSLAYIDALTEYHSSILRMRKALGVDIEKVYGQGG